MYIARIITKNKNFSSFDFVDVSDNLNSIDNIIPTLIIGKKLAEEYIGTSNIKMLDRKIFPNVSWTFSKTERRSIHEEDVNNFYQSIYKNMIRNAKYTFFNILISSLSRIKCFIKYVNNDQRKWFYVTKNHIYIYSEGKYFGISLDDLEYIGIKRSRILSKITKNKNNVVYDSSCRIPNELFNYLYDKKYLIPYFLSLKDAI